MKIAINRHWQNKQPPIPESIETVDAAPAAILVWLAATYGDQPWVSATTAAILQKYLDRGQPPETAVSNAFFRWYNGRFANVDITAQEVATAVSSGFGYAAQHKGYRHQKNFTAAQHIDLDFDTCDYRSTIDYLLDDFVRYAGGAAFIYTTASHTEERPKARIFFELSEPITNPAYYAELRAALLFAYDWADQVNKDPARISYGAAGCKVHWLGHVLDVEDAHQRFVLPYREYQQARKDAAVLAIVEPLELQGDNLQAAFLRGKLDYLLDQVRGAPDGQKYHTLQRVSFTLGGYVVSGYYNQIDISNSLYNAIRGNRNNVKSLPAAYACIDAALVAGMAKPLFIDWTEVKRDVMGEVAAPVATDSTWQTAASIGTYANWMESKRAAVWAAAAA